jgi:hypothetical protein
MRNSGNHHSVDSIPLATILLLIIVARFVSASPSHASSRWKAPNPSTPLDQTRRWREEDDELHKYIASSVPAVLDHTGSDAFDEHLRGVQAILRYWGSPQHLTNAGLFHSICEPKFTLSGGTVHRPSLSRLTSSFTFCFVCTDGTEGFQGFSLPLTERGTIR